MDDNLKIYVQKINSINKPVRLMEVCGTHTMAIYENGIKSLLDEKIDLISGPGCPVCVTPNSYIDYIYELALSEDYIIGTYGDMMRVPGSNENINLQNARKKGGKIKIFYSVMEALNFAIENPLKKIVFLAVGFETTTPSTAVAIKEAYDKSIKNFFILSMHKIMEPAMRCIAQYSIIDGFICPGHVGAIIGEKGFNFLKDMKRPGVITGFNFEEIILGINKLVEMIKVGEVGIKNQYKNLVKSEGNIIAKLLSNDVFKLKDDVWRGLGSIKKSGMKLNDKYGYFDIESIYKLKHEPIDNSGCMCGEILKGVLKPKDCPMFGEKCRPANPIGPCMVSREGTCSAYYKYSDMRR